MTKNNTYTNLQIVYNTSKKYLYCILLILCIDYVFCRAQNCFNDDTLDPLSIDDYCMLINKAKLVIGSENFIEMKILVISKHISDIDTNEIANWYPPLDSAGIAYFKERINDSIQVALLWSVYYYNDKIEWALLIMSKDELWTVKVERIHGDSPMLRRYSSPPKNEDVFHFLQSDDYAFPDAIKEAFKNIRSEKPQPCYSLST